MLSGTGSSSRPVDTRAFLRGCISIYDIQRAVADEATKPIYYERRIAKLALDAAELPKLDAVTGSTE